MQLPELADDILLHILRYLPIQYTWRLRRDCKQLTTLFSSDAAIGVAYHKWNTHKTGDYAPGATKQVILDVAGRTFAFDVPDPAIDRSNGIKRMQAFLSGRPVAHTRLTLSADDLSALDTQLRGSWLMYRVDDEIVHLHDLKGRHYYWNRYLDCDYQSQWILTEDIVVCAAMSEELQIYVAKLGEPFRRITCHGHGALEATALLKPRLLTSPAFVSLWEDRLSTSPYAAPPTIPSGTSLVSFS